MEWPSGWVWLLFPSIMKSLSFKHMLSYNGRVTRRLVTGDREEEMGEQGEKPILKAKVKTVVGDRSLP